MKKRKNRYTAGRASRSGLIRSVLKSILGVTAFFAGMVLLSAGLAHSYHALLASPWFMLEGIEVLGIKNLERAQVLNTMKVPRNASLMTLKMATLAERVETLPWVRSVVVRLDAPRRLVVEVVEREPLGVVVAEEPYLVDQEGKVFLRVEREAHPGLLVLEGFSGLGLKEGEYLPLEPFETLHELHACVGRQESRKNDLGVETYRWDPVEGVSFQLASRPIVVHLGSDEFRKKLDRLRNVLLLLEERHWLDAVTRIDLDFHNRAYVEGNFPTSRDS